MSRLFARRDADPVARRLAQLERQGAGTARVAHLCSLLLIGLFSLGSLAALSGSALGEIQTDWTQGIVNLPAVITVAVSGLLVVCMDVAALAAAAQLRLLAARGAPRAERRAHQFILAAACVLESATYAYMSAQYDHPATVIAWALILGRAAGAPVFSVYLSMLRPVPVLPRDILHEASLAAGAGLVRDVVTIASDPDAPTASKAAIFGAAAEMPALDRARLDGLLAVVTTVDAASSSLPTGPGSPSLVPSLMRHASGTLDDEAMPTPHVLRLPAPRAAQPAARGTTERRVRAALARTPHAAPRDIAKRLGISQRTARKWLALVRAEESRDEEGGALAQ